MDALAVRGDERRDTCEKLRGAGYKALIRKCLNGETQLREPQLSSTEYIGTEKRTRGTETSKYPEEKKSTEIPQVVASERGAASVQKHEY